MKFVVCILLVSVVSSTRFLSEWDKFKRDYNKHYASVGEEAERQQIFVKNLNRIREYQRTHPDLSFTIAINGLADRRTEELVSGSRRVLAIRPSMMRKSVRQQNLPEALDWRSRGVISAVHSQGLVADVTAVVATELVETLNAIRTMKLEEGSIDRVDDCCPKYFAPFECIANMSGICRKTDYPAATGQCLPNKCQPFARFDRIREIQMGDEKTMLEAIQESTLYAGIDASQSSFQFYLTGVYKETKCSQTVIDHVLQIVGYGKTNDNELYWLCKNSWGTSWGDQGYIRILRDKNTCGITTQVIQVASTTTSHAKTMFTIDHLHFLLVLFSILASAVLRR